MLAMWAALAARTPVRAFATVLLTLRQSRGRPGERARDTLNVPIGVVVNAQGAAASRDIDGADSLTRCFMNLKRATIKMPEWLERSLCARTATPIK